MKEIYFILMAFNSEVDPKYLQKELEHFYHVKCKVVTEKEINLIAWDKSVILPKIQIKDVSNNLLQSLSPKVAFFNPSNIVSIQHANQ